MEEIDTERIDQHHLSDDDLLMGEIVQGDHTLLYIDSYLKDMFARREEIS